MSLVSAPAGSIAADWPQFLGPTRDGRSPEKIVESFGPEGPKIRWRNQIGHGLAGPIVAGGKVIVFHRDGGEAIVEAFDVADGKSRWRAAYPTDYRDDFGMDDGPRSVPTVAGGRVFSYGAEGRLQAVDLADGRVLWKRDLAAEFDSPKGWFGRCCSPLVAGERVLVNVGGRHAGKPAGIAAFNVKSGQIEWIASEDEASYSSPILTTLHDRAAAVFFTRKGLEVVDPRDGAAIFKAPFEPDISASVTACTPVMCGRNRVFLSACYSVGACVWDFDQALKGREVWRETGRLDSHYATPIFLDGHPLRLSWPAGGGSGPPLRGCGYGKSEMEFAGTAGRFAPGRRAHTCCPHGEGRIGPRGCESGEVQRARARADSRRRHAGRSSARKRNPLRARWAATRRGGYFTAAVSANLRRTARLPLSYATDRSGSVPWIGNIQLPARPISR